MPPSRRGDGPRRPRATARDAARWLLARGSTGQWRPGQLDADHFRGVVHRGEAWIAEADGRVAGAWELWWEVEDAWGPQPPVAGCVHRLMVDRGTVRQVVPSQGEALGGGEPA